MIRVICCSLLLAFCMHALAQQSLLDSLQALPKKLALDPNVSSANCTNKVNSYKTKFAAITIDRLDTTLKALRKLNGELINPMVKNCPAAQAVYRLDSMLNAQMSQGFPDSLKILNTVAYVKNHFTGLVRLQIDFSDSTVKSKNPTVSVQSFDSFIALPSSMPVEVFVNPGKKYLLTIQADGYRPETREIRAAKDTVVSVSSLQEIGQQQQGRTDQSHVDKSFWERYWWAVALLAAIISIGAGLVVGKVFSGGSKKISSVQPDLQNELKERDKIIENNRKQIERLHADRLALANSMKEPKEGTAAAPSSRHFVTEIMMTAGPRKKPMNEANSDKDLGEDVCGFVTAVDQLLVWLLDGTSDLYCLRNPVNKREYFSSRLLAQSIARKLKSHFTSSNFESLETAMAAAIADVRTDWMHAINSLPESEKNVLKNNIREGNFPECATTVLAGRLTLNGALNVYRSGDSKMFLFTGGRNFLDTPLAGKNDQSNDRVFFRMVLSQAGELDILHNQPLFESNDYNRIETMIGFSDGIGKATEEQFRSAFVKNPDGVREEIMYQLQGTEDDKALFIIEIKP